jgi:hypothetical protein
MPLAPDSNLKERGWEEPLDESPVDTPDGWRGGGVVHTGGGIYCRIWTTKTDAQCDTTDPKPGVYYEAVYGDEFDGVVIDVYEYSEDSDLWDRREELDRELCSEETDLCCADIAVELMEKHSPPSTDTAPPELSWDDLTGTYEAATISITSGQFLQAYVKLTVDGEPFIARVPIDEDQLEDDITNGEYEADIVVAANDWPATHDPSDYDNRDDDWKRRVHCLFKLGDTAVEAAIDEVCHEAKDGDRIWAGWTTGAQPTAEETGSDSSSSSTVSEGSE